MIACLHAEFQIGGLTPGESKSIRRKLNRIEADPDSLLHRDEAERIFTDRPRIAPGTVSW